MQQAAGLFLAQEKKNEPTTARSVQSTVDPATGA
jgi:hypothetical protein